MTTIIPPESLQNEEISIKTQIISLSADLLYLSESDEKIEYFEMELSTTEKISLANFRMFNGIRPELTIEEMESEKFFAPLIKMEDWFGDDEKKWAEDSLKLKQLLMEQTKDIQVLKVGQVEVDLYLFGKAEECKWVGLKTKVVET
jgi:Nuclease A inhibitor-like protein